jgi:hypothetical protein
MKDAPFQTRWGLKSPTDSGSFILREEDYPAHSVCRFLAGCCSARMIPVASSVFTPADYRLETKESMPAAVTIPKNVKAEASSISPGRLSEIVRTYESMLGLHAEATGMTT